VDAAVGAAGVEVDVAGEEAVLAQAHPLPPAVPCLLLVVLVVVVLLAPLETDDDDDDDDDDNDEA